MSFRSLVVAVLVTLSIIALGAFGWAYFTNSVGGQSYLEKLWICSLAVGFIGMLMNQGASSGGDALVEQAVRQTSLDPRAYQEADAKDMRVGVSLGIIILGSAALAFVGSLIALNYLY